MYKLEVVQDVELTWLFGFNVYDPGQCMNRVNINETYFLHPIQLAGGVKEHNSVSEDVT